MANFKNKVVYQIYPKSFCDSNGDGLGDLKGITSKLDYLQDLGVELLWSTPFFPSPQRDNGYDVADYCAVDPRFGTMEDLEELIAEADERGIGLMLDMVFNHTSTEHEWFQKALAGDKKYQDYYIFKDGTADKIPTNWVSKFGGPAWEYVPSLGKWYLHLFDVTQADLNWENPAVREELKQVLRFWKKKRWRSCPPEAGTMAVLPCSGMTATPPDSPPERPGWLRLKAITRSTPQPRWRTKRPFAPSIRSWFGCARKWT